MRAARLSVVTAVATAAALTAVTGCTEKSKGDGDAAVQVTAADSKCDTSTKSVPAGQVTLKIENKGSQATEVEILFPDDRIVSEKENIGPGTKYTLTAEVVRLCTTGGDDALQSPFAGGLGRGSRHRGGGRARSRAGCRGRTGCGGFCHVNDP